MRESKCEGGLDLSAVNAEEPVTITDPPNPSDIIKLEITFNKKTQSADVVIADRNEFRSWEFVIAVIEMAKEKATNARDVTRMQMMQQAAIDQHAKMALAGATGQRIKQKLVH